MSCGIKILSNNLLNEVVFEQEIACKYPEFEFVTTLPLIEFVPIPRPEEIPQ